MENKTPKEIAVEKVYGDKYDWDENGWLYYSVDEHGESGYEPFGEYDKRNEIDGSFEWRPISLRGLEDNNGWFILPTKKILPYGYYWVRVKQPTTLVEDEFIFHLKDGVGIIPYAYATHYQPIEKPQPPIY